MQLAAMPQRPDGTDIDWGAPILAAWQKDISERAALRLLDRFIADGMSHYEARRHFADARGVSKLSPFLRFGQLSARLMMAKLTAVRPAYAS